MRRIFGYQCDMKSHRIQPTSEHFPIVRWIAIAAIALLAITALSGCKSRSTASAGVNPVGLYNLVSVDGKTLPCSVAHAGSPTVKSGVFTFNADGTCASKIIMSTPSGSEVTREVKATYTCEGSKLTMKWAGAGTTTGTLTNDSFTMNNEGIVFAYRK